MTHAALTRISMNSKTGPIPVSTSENTTCPLSCPFMENGCYAELGHVAIHFNKVSRHERGTDWKRFCNDIKTLPNGILWRYSVAGDLPGHRARINQRELSLLIEANKRKRGFAYTHKPLTPSNIRLIREANEAGFTVNVSVESEEAADRAIAHGLPVAMVIEDDSIKHGYTPAGHKWAICPHSLAQANSQVNCSTCQLCQDSNRSVIIALPVHGTRKQKARAVVKKARPLTAVQKIVKQLQLN